MWRRDEMEEKKNLKSEFLLTSAGIVLFALSFVPAFGAFETWLCLAAVLIAGRGTVKEGLEGLVRFSFGEEALMLIAVAAAFLIGECHEGAMVAILFSVGEEMEDLAIDRSRDRIRALADIRPDRAHIVTDSGTEDSAAESVETGTRILIRVGERVPLDCEVLDETAIADTSAITGESIPQSFLPGDVLKAGYVVQVSPVTAVTVSGYGDSAAARIIDLVQNAAEKKGSTEKFITKFARVYTPSVIALAAALFLATWLTGSLTVTDAAHRALVFLVSSCPCALVLSIPLAYFAGIGTASKYGVIIKGSEYCEKLANAENAVFDKTGTLTTGVIRVCEIRALSGFTEDMILGYAAAAEKYSEHPIARCILSEAESRGIAVPGAERINELAGEGVTVETNGVSVAAGNMRLCERLGIDVPKGLDANIYVAADGNLAGCVYLEDTVSESSVSAIESLRRLGIKRTVMLTGDKSASAKKAAAECGIDEVYSGLMPEDKLAKIEEIKKTGITVFAGDGINDAPVLAAADIGAAIGMGTDAAVESADIVLMKDGISSLPCAVDISKRIVACVKQNIAFILAVKAVVLMLGAFGYAPIWLAVFADVGLCFLALLWSLRLTKISL